MKLRNLLCTASAVLTLSISSLSFSQTNYTNMIIFGDSLSDIGNVPSAPFTNHQADNKTPIWVNDVMATLFPSASIYASTHKPNSNDTASLNLDYAWGGALTGPSSKEEVPPVTQQVATFMADVQNKPSKTALYIIWAGANDIFSLVPQSDMTTTQQRQQLNQALCALKTDPSQCQTAPQPPVTPIKNLVSVVNTLKSAGIPGDHIFVLNLPDLSYTPKAIAFTKGDPNLLMGISALSELFNADLGLDFEGVLPADHIISAYTFMHQTLTDPSKHGFTDIKDSCTSEKAEPLCKGYVFNDSIHPTIAAHQLLGQFILQAIQ